MKFSVDTIRVHDQNEALEHYTKVFGWVVKSDMPMGKSGRWLTVAPKEDEQVQLVLQPDEWFSGEELVQHRSLVGKDPTRVFYVEDCMKAYQEWK